MITKNRNESKADFIGRVCSLKREMGLTWKEVTELLNNELGEFYSERTYRRKYRDWTRNSIPEKSYEEEDYENLLQTKIRQLQEEQIRLRDIRSQLTSLTSLKAREEMMCETAIECANTIAQTIPLDFPKPIKPIPCDKEGILTIGDWHYGVDINEFWNVYNPIICKNRVKQLSLRALDIIEKEQLNKIHVLNLGDMVSGRIHLPLRINSRLDVVSQTMEVAELIAEFLSFLSEFVNIEYYSVSDNHSRVEPNKKESLQTEAFSRIIDWFLKERLKDNTNIHINTNEISDDICTFSVFDYAIAAVHGDKDKVRTLIKNINTYTHVHHDLILSAHSHHFSADEDNDTIRLCNGSLMGGDDYSSKLRLNSPPSQLFIISTKNNITECIYKINLEGSHGTKK